MLNHLKRGNIKQQIIKRSENSNTFWGTIPKNIDKEYFRIHKSIVHSLSTNERRDSFMSTIDTEMSTLSKRQRWQEPSLDHSLVINYRVIGVSNLQIQSMFFDATLKNIDVSSTSKISAFLRPTK